ncbi:MAG: glycosyl transferase family 28 [Rhodospirillales bacterium]|nr:glycosyl transferase family 28 [Rhodospirillales bacterium]
MSGVLFYVQHLLGVGHVKRAASIARALVGARVPVTVVLGGERVSHTDFGGADVRYLASARAEDESFKILLDQDNQPIDDAWRDARRRQLLKIAEEIRPDILFIELFPFGRRQFRFELIPLLEAHKGRSKIVCSARDVIVGKPSAKRNDEIVDTLLSYFDSVLVHGVEAVIPLASTFPDSHRIADLLQYTGYVVEQAVATTASDVGVDEVVVSVGGGAVGEDLLRAVVAARPYSVHQNRHWRLIAGESLPAGAYQDIEACCGTGISLERARSDFIYVLRNCALSISLGGYNTVMDVMAAGCANLVVPFSGGVETEQLFRARAFAARGWIHMFDGELENHEEFAKAIDEAMAQGKSVRTPLDMGGAEKTAQLISEML